MVLQEALALPDSEVVERVRHGDSPLYEVLMRRYNQRLFRTIRSVIPDDEEAEDILQETWVRAYEHLNQFEGRASFATWVSRIGFHEALARSRNRKRWTPVEDAEGDIMPEANRHTESDTPEMRAMRGELGQILESAMDALPDTYRSVFVLREVEQLSTLETAESLGLSEEAVKTRLHRGRALLRRDIADRMGMSLSGSYAFLGPRCDRTVARVLERIGAPPSTVPA